MSKFLGKQAASLTPYTPGEQPQGKRYIKLNTNECPYPPSPLVAKALAEQDAGSCRLYPDPAACALRQKLAERYGVSTDQVFVGNGSDDVLGFAFLAFFDRGDTVSFPDPGYGFYPVYADLCGLKANPIPLKEDFAVEPRDYFGRDGNILFANTFNVLVWLVIAVIYLILTIVVTKILKKAIAKLDVPYQPLASSN